MMAFTAVYAGMAFETLCTGFGLKRLQTVRYGKSADDIQYYQEIPKRAMRRLR